MVSKLYYLYSLMFFASLITLILLYSFTIEYQLKSKQLKNNIQVNTLLNQQKEKAIDRANPIIPKYIPINPNTSKPSRKNPFYTNRSTGNSYKRKDLEISDYVRGYDGDHLLFDRQLVPVSNGTYPIRDANIQLNLGEITSIYPDICSRYGSGVIPDGIYNYMPSKWCDIGILYTKDQTVPYTALSLSAQFVSTTTPSGWRYRVFDAINKTYIFLPDNTIGSGSWHSLSNNDILNTIPGKPGNWTVQIQTN